MGWLSELSTAYDRAIKSKKIEDKPLPLYHIKNNAPLIVTLNGEGKFLSAKFAERTDWQTCMPCTEKSAARTSGVEAYPFCDKLEYVAADYADYVKGKNLDDKHQKYLFLLGSWTQSECSNQKIKSVFKYVKKGTLVKDILKKGNIPEMDTETKIATGDCNFFVRWIVETDDNSEFRTWLDDDTIKLWIKYYSNNYLSSKDFCYITGKNEAIAELHPAKIRNAGDSAKLISSNDSSNYTFRGRFADAAQACQIGMEVSVKAHNALRWFIERQGATVGNGLTVVAWGTASDDVKPQLLKSTNDLGFDDGEEEQAEQENYTGLQVTAQTIKNRLLGYYGRINDNDRILIMALNAATPGRMSILLYREFMKSDFFEAQEYWHNHLAWFYTYWKKGEKSARHTISAPSPEEIVKTAYGGHVSDSAKAMTVQRLLSCIIDKTAIPNDIEQLCFCRASRLSTLESSEREKTLETACAVIKYNLFAKYEEDYAVEIIDELEDRDILYGRLLAIADKIESTVLDEREENRQSNAVRYMQRFAKYPCSTWKLLYVDKLQPYLKYLKQMHPKLLSWYESIIQGISEKIIKNDFVTDDVLSGKFLLGYHWQQKDFWRKREKDQSVNGSKQED